MSAPAEISKLESASSSCFFKPLPGLGVLGVEEVRKEILSGVLFPHRPKRIFDRNPVCVRVLHVCELIASHLATDHGHQWAGEDWTQEGSKWEIRQLFSHVNESLKEKSATTYRVYECRGTQHELRHKAVVCTFHAIKPLPKDQVAHYIVIQVGRPIAHALHLAPVTLLGTWLQLP